MLSGIVLLACVLTIVLAVIALRRTKRFQQRLQRQQEEIQRQLEQIGKGLALLSQSQQQAQETRQRTNAQQTQETIRMLSAQQTQVMAQLEEMQQWTAARFEQLHLELFGQADAPAGQDQRLLTKHEKWQRLVQSAIDGDGNALLVIQQALGTDASVQTIGIADARKYQNNTHYAEFTAQSTGACLLLPLENGNVAEYVALPYPSDTDWFVRNHALLSRLFRFNGDWRNLSKPAHIRCAAILREKEATDYAASRVYELVQPGVLDF